MYKENGKGGGKYGGTNNRSTYSGTNDRSTYSGTNDRSTYSGTNDRSTYSGTNGRSTYSGTGRSGSNYGRSGSQGAGRGGPRTDGEGAPVSFKNGEPVFRDAKPYGKTGRSYDRSYKKTDADAQSPRKYGDKYDRGDRRAENTGKKPYRQDNKPVYGKPDTRPVKPVESEAVRPAVQEDELPYLVIGRNAVREAIKSGRSIDKILVSRDPDGSLREIMGAARDRNIRIDEVDKSKLDEMCLPFGHGGKTGNHQGILAQVPGVEYCELSDMLADAKAAGEKPFIILLDGIEDPHNLGSIIRSAVCAGAHGVVIPRRRAVSVTAAACKASAGAVEYCRVARVANLAGAIDRLKDEGLWIAGADMQGMPMGRARMEGALALVIGGEGGGISHLIKEKCDFLVSIPMTGKLDSLNASVAAAVLMFEKRRQDGASK